MAKIEINQELGHLGLHKSDITVYRFLIENGISEPRDIAKKTGILRTNCYAILDRLEERGLISKHSKDHPVSYVADNPVALYKDIEKRKGIVSEILPELLNVYKNTDNKPTIKFYEGKEAVKDIFFQILDSGDVLGFAATNKLHELYPGFITGDWQEQFSGQEKGILRDILVKEGENEAAANLKEKLQGRYDYRVLSEKYGDIATDLLVWEDNVALINLEEPVFGTVILNKQIATMLKLMFELIWESLKEQ